MTRVRPAGDSRQAFTCRTRRKKAKDTGKVTSGRLCEDRYAGPEILTKASPARPQYCRDG